MVNANSWLNKSKHFVRKNILQTIKKCTYIFTIYQYPADCQWHDRLFSFNLTWNFRCDLFKKNFDYTVHFFRVSGTFVPKPGLGVKRLRIFKFEYSHLFMSSFIQEELILSTYILCVLCTLVFNFAKTSVGLHNRARKFSDLHISPCQLWKC